MNRADKAVSLFREKYLCSQSILAAFGPGSGLDHNIALKISAGFGGGIGRSGHTCGAVAGAVMAIGLKYGATEPGDTDTRLEANRIVREFIRRFEERRGSIACRDLIGCDISTPGGYRTATEQNLFDSICTRIVAEAAAILDELI